MQRALVILAVFVLVTTALAIGVLAAHWPFWARAWHWHQAAEGWPESLPGPVQVVKGGASALPLQLQSAPLPPAAAASGTGMVLVANSDGRGTAYLAAGSTTRQRVDGRGFAAGLLAPLYGVLSAEHAGLLDAPAGEYIERWRKDSRGAITPRHLLWQLSGLPVGNFRPLNPASSRAQLASGPDFDRAARRWRQTWPAGSHFEDSPVNAQVLALIASRMQDSSYTAVLERQLWSQFAADDAVVTLDHRRGDMAAHCCMRASAEDWLRLGLLLADDGRVGARRLWAAGFVDEMARDSPVHPGYGFGYRIAELPEIGKTLILDSAGRRLLVAPGLRRALLWIGAGTPPEILHQLLAAETASPGRD